MPYRALFFDLGNVLVPFDLRRAYGALEACSTVPVAEMASRLRISNLAAEYECGRLDDLAFYEAIRNLLELRCAYEEFCTIWNSIFLPPTMVPEQLLANLKKSYTLLLLSNTNAIHFRYLQQHYPHIAHFHFKTLSHEAGAQKPDASIYRQALATAEVDPCEVFFTDDLQENIDAARALGIDAERFVDVESLEGHLRARGILKLGGAG